MSCMEEHCLRAPFWPVKSTIACFNVPVWASKKHPLRVEDPQLGHEVKIDKGQADQ